LKYFLLISIFVIMRDKIKASITNALHHEKHKAEIKERKRLWYLANKKDVKIKNKIWRNANKTHLNSYQIEYSNKQYKTNSTYKLKTRIRKAIRESFNSHGFKKTSKTQIILGCSFDEFKIHIENQFESWMTWENHGLFNSQPNYGWDIDHIIPLASSKCKEDIIKLNHYTNLRPLCSYTNRIVKRDKLF